MTQGDRIQAVPLQTLPASHDGGVAPMIPATSLPVENEESCHHTETLPGNVGYTLTSKYRPGPFVPVSDEDAAQLPELNFRPLALKVGYLVPAAIWFFLCFAGVAVLATVGGIQPPWFHLESQYSYELWIYVPGIIGFFTTVIWRGTVQSYNRIIPYVRMANVRSSYTDTGNSTLWVVGDYLSFVVNFSPLITPFLTPVKSGIFQLVGDATGWGIRVSVPFCTIAMFIYAWLFVLTLAILLHLHKNRTGLKWNPCTLATQLSMIQGSDLFDELVDIPPGERAPLNSAVRSWPKKKMLLRLGYWRELGTDHIIYGIRFLPGEEPLQIDSGMERAAGGGNVGGRPDFVDVSATTVSYGRGRELDGYMKSGSDRGRVSSHMDSSPAHFAETASNDHRATASTYNEPTLVRQRPRSAQPDVDRIWNCWLRDFYLVVITLIGTAALITATITWAKGYIYRPFHFPVPSREKHGSEGQNTSMGQDLVRNIVFDLLPSALFGIFNLSLLSADVYQRCMMPIENMASPLPEEDRKRLSFEEEHIKGATARESMLLDYISLDIISCIVAAISGGHYRIILGAVLATLSNAVFIVVGRVFAVGKGDASGYSVSIQPRNFYASFAIMVVYCISIWILRPRGVTRTCRPVFTLMDLAVLVHQSHILQCPEFWLESSSDTEEHMKGQVMLANRLYRFGVFTGMDDHDHVGISIHEVPRAWIRRNPEDIPHLRYSMELARDVLKFGLCDESSVAFAHDFLTTGPRTQLKLRKVYSNDYHRWSQMVKRLIGKTSKKDAEEGLNDDSGDNTSHDVTEGRSSSYQRREGNSESAHPRGLDSELSEVLPRV